MRLEDLNAAQRAELERVVAAENADRVGRGLAPLSAAEYLASGFRHSFLTAPAGASGAASPRSAAASIDHAAIYAKLNAPTSAPAGRDGGPGAMAEPTAGHTDGEAFAESIFARANARSAKPDHGGDGE